MERSVHNTKMRSLGQKNNKKLPLMRKKNDC
jgi:hypothetical protein